LITRIIFGNEYKSSGCINFSKNLGSTLKILSAIRVTWTKPHPLDPRISRATIKNSVAMATWRPVFVYTWHTSSKYEFPVSLNAPLIFSRPLQCLCYATHSGLMVSVTKKWSQYRHCPQVGRIYPQLSLLHTVY
jgi:hypothetical protein